MEMPQIHNITLDLTLPEYKDFPDTVAYAKWLLKLQAGDHILIGKRNYALLRVHETPLEELSPEELASGETHFSYKRIQIQKCLLDATDDMHFFEKVDTQCSCSLKTAVEQYETWKSLQGAARQGKIQIVN